MEYNLTLPDTLNAKLIILADSWQVDKPEVLRRLIELGYAANSADKIVLHHGDVQQQVLLK